jgi:hypothetical protein
MTNLIWIDLDEAAGWLSSNPDDVMSLIREGILGSKRRSRDNIVVRADDVSCLAEFWTDRRPKKRTDRSKRPSTNSCLLLTANCRLHAFSQGRCQDD